MLTLRPLPLPRHTYDTEISTITDPELLNALALRVNNCGNLSIYNSHNKRVHGSQPLHHGLVKHLYVLRHGATTIAVGITLENFSNIIIHNTCQ